MYWWWKVGTSKKIRGGKQWQAIPKTLPRMQRTRTIPVAWLNSGLCPDRHKGWIPIINSNNVYCQPGKPYLERMLYLVIIFLYLSYCIFIKMTVWPHKEVKLKQSLDRTWGFQYGEAHTFQDIRHMKVVMLSALSTVHFYPPGNIPGIIYVRTWV